MSDRALPDTTDPEQGWLPLTAAQQGLFFAHQLDPDNPCYTTAEVVELTGPVDEELLTSALAAAYDEFEQLRTVFRLTPDGPQQRVVARGATLRVVQVGSAAEAEEWLRADLARPMDLLGEPIDSARTALLRLPDGSSWWYHAAHHVVLDGYGVQQLLKRVAELYADPELYGGDAAPAATLAEVVAGEPDDPDGAAAWDARLATMSGTSSLARRTAAPSPAAIKRSVVLSEDQQAALAAGARRLGVGWPDLFTAAVGGYVARMAGLGAARVGLPLMNRSSPGVGTLPSARTVCTAMNVLPATVPADGTVADALAATAAEQQALRAHPLVRQEELARRLRARDPGAQLFGAQVNLVPFELEVRLAHPDGREGRGTVRNLTAGPVEDLTVCLRGTPGRRRTVRLEIDANPALYDADEVELHLDRLAAFVEAYAAADAGTPVADLPLLTARERALVVEGFNDTAVEREPATLGERFAAQAARTPDATALVFESEHRSYAELLDAARRVAAGLAAKGVGSGEVVGVALPRGLGLYEVVHGIELLGAVYLPLDPDLPVARADGMLEDAHAAYVVTPETLPDVMRMGTSRGGDRMTSAGAGVDDPAYLLFTSGSTGRPKGVLVGHRAIDNRLAWMQHHLPLREGDRVLHKTPISFDVSIWELFWPLQVGATVVVAPPGAHRDPRALAELVVDERVTTLHFVPSMLRAFLGDRVARARVAAGAVRTVVTSGEALTPDLVEGCATAFGVAPTNLYGPTEAAVDVTCWDCEVGEESVPIGRPVWNTSCYVLDPRLRPQPVGVPGELWLGGVQLAEGYVGRPDLTAERFVDTAYGRLYRTGDLAAWRPDGALRYLGRTDDQVKIRGQRVELGEVEAALAGVPTCAAAAAGVVENRLVVWFVPSDADAAETERALRDAAAARLPESWLPHHWVAVDDIPLGTSGKTDRRRLAETAPPVVDTDGDDLPRSLLEQRLCAIVADVLDRPTVGPHADFFALGGDSLLVLRLLSAVEDDLGATLALADVFARPTAAGLAALVAGDVDGAPDMAEVLTLRPGAERPPLFLLPPAGGLGWCYAGLLRSLPPEQGVYSVQAPGIAEGRPEPVADLAALARRQLAAIRSIVGDGAFHVAGWSLGGMAAHEVAALARSEEQEVGAVVLLDAYPSDQWQHLTEPTEAEALVGILRLGGVEPPPNQGLDRAAAVRLLRESGSAVGRLPEQVLEGCLASVVEAARIVRTSRHRVLPGDLTVLVAAAPRDETWLDASGWAPYVEGEVYRVDVPASHGELLRRPVVDEVGSLLAGLLG
ncbi:amino acid adenylation domain-containing protein [Nocardioides sp. KR10-350]|uniref:amino acid adenylation domain-containing protein n=1 Tax=Nocardioides cheoyonin TaxID=3156615 RepID=UPI0032B62310